MIARTPACTYGRVFGCQSLPYKIDLGGQLMPRLEFLDKFHSVRDQPFPVFATDADGFLLHTDSRAQMATNGT